MINRERFPANEWRFVEREYDASDLNVTETLFALGNGYLGLRGNNSEGRDSHEHGTFINGFHETWPIRHAEQAYGFAEVGQTIVNVPDAKVIRLYVDDEPLAMEEADLFDYERSIDFRDGVLRRSLVWLTPSGKRVRVESSRLVSFTERHLAILTFEVTLLDADAPVAISCQLLNRQDGQNEYGRGTVAPTGFDPRKAESIKDRVLQPAEYWQDGSRSVLSYRTTNSGMTIAVAADHYVETDNEVIERKLIEPDIAKNVYRVQAKAGVPIRVTKTVSYHTSRGVPPKELIDRCRRTLDRVAAEGIHTQFEKQLDWLDAYWERSDVEIEGEPEAQQAVRWNLFQLAQASARADGRGIPAKGVTGSGYSGHYFWDTEVYVLPYLTYTSPLFARNALRMRYQMLPAARKRARDLNELGALFPWRTINGEEASAYYAAGTAQYHIDADIAYAVAKYAWATGDDEFLAREGDEILVETARMWTTLGFWRDGDDSSFHIHGVTGPDEYTTVVNDNLFTNVMARFNLHFAVRSLRALARDNPDAYVALAHRMQLLPGEVDDWEQAAEAIAIPFDDNVGIHPQDAQFLEREVWDLANTPSDQRPLLLHFHPLVIYRFQVLKQADVVLALFLQGNQFTAEEKRADFEYYDPLTTGDSTLSAVVQSIIAAEVGYQDLALHYFHDALYVDLDNLHGNTADGVHVASAGGVWSALVSGFGGMRDFDGRLSFNPRLPETWPSMTFRMTWHGTLLIFTVRQDSFTAIAAPNPAGAPIEFEVRGETLVLSPGESVTVPLHDQGPVLPGQPSQRRQRHTRRDDGSLMTASIPVVTKDESVPDE